MNSEVSRYDLTRNEYEIFIRELQKKIYTCNSYKCSLDSGYCNCLTIEYVALIVGIFTKISVGKFSTKPSNELNKLICQKSSKQIYIPYNENLKNTNKKGECFSRAKDRSIFSPNSNHLFEFYISFCACLEKKESPYSNYKKTMLLYLYVLFTLPSDRKYRRIKKLFKSLKKSFDRISKDASDDKYEEIAKEQIWEVYDSKVRKINKNSYECDFLELILTSFDDIKDDKKVAIKIINQIRRFK